MNPSNYLATRSVQDAQGFYVNMGFDLVTGCPFSCDGCFVNKTLPVILTEPVLDRLDQITQSFLDNGDILYLAVIDPTDFLVADNTIELLRNERVVTILRRFEKIAFQTTLLNVKNVVAISQAVQQAFPNHPLEINLLLEIDQLENQKYLDVLVRNKQIVRDAFSWAVQLEHYNLLNVYNYSQTKIAHLLNNYETIYTRVKQVLDVALGFNFSLGRKGQYLTSQDFIEAVNQVKSIYTSLANQSNENYGVGDTGMNPDTLMEKFYFWASGEFYYAPLMYERYVSFIEPLRIPTPTNHARDFEAFETQFIDGQFEHIHTKDECGSCPLLSDCLMRGTLGLMDIYAMTSCPLPKNSPNVIESMGTIP